MAILSGGALSNQGDDTYSGWLGPYDSGEIIKTSHVWSVIGSFEVKVKAKDIHFLESEWSDPLSITMPKDNLIIQRLIV